MRFREKIVLATVSAFVFALFAHPVCADADTIVEDVKSSVKASVKSGWKQLEKYSEKISELREERKLLPDTSSWTKLWLDTNKSDQDAKIRSQLGRVRELLLSTSARKILKGVDELDEDIRKNALVAMMTARGELIAIGRMAMSSAKLRTSLMASRWLPRLRECVARCR